ncbi:PHP domain-containing protein [Bowdeniella nasicola]|uniref:PHP domain-containing protein n=1 Tax=Bowdeniella nasicola TaxID=208480 RepID=UPI003183E64B
MTLRIDPHAHTTHSDGTDSVRGLLQAAKDADLDIVGITDHDTVAGWQEAEALAPEIGIGVLRGVEISCRADGITVHLLSFLHDPQNRELADVFESSRAERLSRAKAIADRLARDFPISWQDIVAHAGTGATIGRPHLADALVRAGVVPDRSAAFDQLLHPSSPYYVPYVSPHPVEVTALVRKAGGVPVLAHPRAYQRQRRVLGVDVIEQMSHAGLFALEADHRDHGPAARDEVKDLARRLGLRVSGGSDYHGSGKPNRLGENLMAADVLQAMEEEGYMSVVRP